MAGEADPPPRRPRHAASPSSAPDGRRTPMQRVDDCSRSQPGWTGSGSSALFLAREEGDQVEELLHRDQLLEALGHDAQGLPALVPDVGPGDGVLPALAVREREGPG